MDDAKLNKALDKLSQVAARLKALDQRQTGLEARRGTVTAKKDFLAGLLAAAAVPEEMEGLAAAGVGAASLASGAANAVEGVSNTVSNTLNGAAQNAQPHEATTDSAAHGNRGPDPADSPAPTRFLFDSEQSGGMADKLEEMWNVIQSLADMLNTLGERMDGIEDARTDSLGVRGSDPIAEKRGGMPRH